MNRSSEANPAGNWDVYVVGRDGKGVRRLTTGRSVDGAPVWSPDGRQIAFTSDRDGDSNIYVMNSDGTGQRRLTTSPVNEFSSAWSPDGAKLAFDRGGSGVFEIFVMNADGSGVTQLTSDGQWNASPTGHPTARASPSRAALKTRATSMS